MNKGDQSAPNVRGILATAFFYIIAAILAICGLRVAFWGADGAAAKNALLLLAAAIGVVFAREAMLIIPRIQRLKVLDKIDLTLAELEQTAVSAERKADSAVREATAAAEKAAVAWDSAKQLATDQGSFGGSARSSEDR